MTSEATITTKGQVTIPKAIRDRMGLKPGDKIEFVEERGTVRVRKRAAAQKIDKWMGYLKELKGKDPDELIEEWRGR